VSEQTLEREFAAVVQSWNSVVYWCRMSWIFHGTSAVHPVYLVDHRSWYINTHAHTVIGYNLYVQYCCLRVCVCVFCQHLSSSL